MLGLLGSAVAVEITEGLLLNASPAVAERLLAYRDAGIQVAIDDFGTGYSALSYLSRLPIDTIKIDRSFIQAIEQPIPFEGQDLRVSASIGIALFPQDARDTQTLMKQADTALYHAKESGRGRYSYFTGIMSAKAEQRMRVEHDLRFALANNDFFLAYQPKVTLPDGRITGMEALVRWRRCDTGEVVPPAEFIPIAEETGLITQLDEWVMREACRQNVAWQAAGLPAIPVSVNVSLARFDPDRLLAHVEEVLGSTGMAPQWLEIEFTEGEMFHNLERAQTLIAQLKALGVQVAIDDFGTGYSGLSYLMRYRFDVLKIDRSFVQGLPDDPRNTAIVQAIVAMARALDYRVVAEGVETFAQADSLRGYGCNEMQGFLYGRPVPAAEFAACLRRGVIDVVDYEALPRRA
jgi:EAL domain-containing protein (putative c-di-GMP-specific phosphodiesterase class I)